MQYVIEEDSGEKEARVKDEGSVSQVATLLNQQQLVSG